MWLMDEETEKGGVSNSISDCNRQSSVGDFSQLSIFTFVCNCSDCMGFV